MYNVSEAMYFYIYPSFGAKFTFELSSCTFGSKFENVIHIFNKSKTQLAKEDHFFEFQFLFYFRNGAL